MVESSLSGTKLTFSGEEFELADVLYECYSADNGYPCSFSEFVAKRATEYPEFDDLSKIYVDTFKS